MSIKRIKVWDLPTRLFHWLLALTVAAALVTGEIGGNLIDWHGRLGLLTVGLVVFRLVWGIVGSTYARFSQFLPTPDAIAAYLKGQWQGLGHNPLGALSVLALLGLVSLQVASGLFANDDIAFNGPLFDLVSKESSDRLTGIHKAASSLLILVIVLHVGAIAFYARVKKHNLVKPMVTGWSEGETGESAQGGGLVALIVALVIAGAAMYGASGQWISTPPPPPPAATPAW